MHINEYKALFILNVPQGPQRHRHCPKAHFP